MNVTLTVDVGDEDRVVLVRRHESEYAAVGTVAEVTDRVSIRGGMRAVTLEGLHRGVIGAAHSDALGRLRAEVEERPDENPPPVQTRELEREYRAVVEEILDLRDADGRVREFLRAMTDAGALADTCAYAPDITFTQRVELLETVDVVERLQLALELQRERLAELQVRRRIRDDVEEGAQKQQREWFLRQQMNSIRKELGEDEGSVVDEYRTKIEEAGMPEDVKAQAERELRRLETMGDQSGEASMIRTYLDWLIAVPWSKRSDETLDPTGAATRLQRSSRCSIRRRTTRSAITTSTSSSISRTSSSSRPRTSRTPSRARFSTVWRSSASTATRSTRRPRSHAATSGRGRS